MSIISAEQLFNTVNGELVSCQGRKNRDSQLNQHLSDVYRSAVNFSRGLQPWRTQDHTLGQVRKIWAVWLLHLTPCIAHLQLLLWEQCRYLCAELRGQILGRTWDKSLQSFPPCSSQSTSRVWYDGERTFEEMENICTNTYNCKTVTFLVSSYFLFFIFYFFFS